MSSPSIQAKAYSEQLVSIAGQPGGDRGVVEQGVRRSLFGLDTAALARIFTGMGEKAYRGKQLAEGLYRQRVTHLDQVTTLPQALRERLAAYGWEIGRPAIVEAFKSVDGTERYLIQTGSQTVETVWMPEGDEGAEASLDERDGDEGAEGRVLPEASG